ncbi:MAG: hypothetical protein IPG86_04985 [Chitinophagaceae bacterium]|nr:hypothetical protein [Chitinophagaceae bacterium]
MALSRIWSAFIIIALLVAGGRFLFQNSRDDIFGRMVSGTAKDEFKYFMPGIPPRLKQPVDLNQP